MWHLPPCSALPADGRGLYFLKWTPNKAFSGLEEKYLQLLLPHLFDSIVNYSKIVNIYLTGFILHLISDTVDHGGKINCFVWWIIFLMQHRLWLSPVFSLVFWRITGRSSEPVSTLSWLKLTMLSRCYGGLACSYPRNYITAAHKGNCCYCQWTHKSFIRYKHNSKM